MKFTQKVFKIFKVDIDNSSYEQPSAYRLTIYRYANIVCFSKYR